MRLTVVSYETVGCFVYFSHPTDSSARQEQFERRKTVSHAGLSTIHLSRRWKRHGYVHLSWGISLIHEFPDSLEVPVKRLIRSWIHNCCRCSVVISARLYQPTPQTRSQISGTPPKISTPPHLAVKIANKIDIVYWILAFNSWLEKAPGIKL